MNDFIRDSNRALSRWLTPAVKAIVVANTAVTFVLTILMVAPGLQNSIVGWLALQPILGALRGQVWRFATYGFVQIDFFHLLFNMLALWFFAPPLENRWGTRRFWWFYMTVIVVAGLMHALFTLALGMADPRGYVIGSSGGVFGVLLAFACYFPNQPILLWGVVPVKAKIIVGVTVFLTFMSAASRSVAAESNISYLTHMTGLITAYLWMARFHRSFDLRRWQYSRSYDY